MRVPQFFLFFIYMLNSVSNGDSIKELDNLIRLFRFCKPLSEKVWEFLKIFFFFSFLENNC